MEALEPLVAHLTQSPQNTPRTYTHKKKREIVTLTGLISISARTSTRNNFIMYNFVIKVDDCITCNLPLKLMIGTIANV